VFRHRRCGHRFTPTVACDACGQPLAWGDVEPLPGPGLRRGPGTRLLGQVITGSGSAKAGAPGTASPTQPAVGATSASTSQRPTSDSQPPGGVRPSTA
jgi:hypothetical protein